jgi:hypothetical protein
MRGAIGKNEIGPPGVARLESERHVPVVDRRLRVIAIVLPGIVGGRLVVDRNNRRPDIGPAELSIPAAPRDTELHVAILVRQRFTDQKRIRQAIACALEADLGAETGEHAARQCGGVRVPLVGTCLVSRKRCRLERSRTGDGRCQAPTPLAVRCRHCNISEMGRSHRGPLSIEGQWIPDSSQTLGFPFRSCHSGNALAGASKEKVDRRWRVAWHLGPVRAILGGL